MPEKYFGEIEIIGRAVPRKRRKPPFSDVQAFIPFMDDVKSESRRLTDYFTNDSDRINFWEKLPDNYDGELE